LNPLASPPRADRILIVRLGAVGDVARTLPAAACLRAAWPGAHLAWLVEPPAASLVAAQPWVDEAIVFPRPPARARSEPVSARMRPGPGLAALSEIARCLASLRARHFDLVVDFHSILRSAVLALATGARRRVVYARPFGRELAWLLATHRARVAPERVSRFERNEALVRFLGAPAHRAARPIGVDAAAVAAMRERLGPGAPPLAIHPGTSDGARRKRIPAAVLARAARSLHAELGIPAVVTFGPARDDRPLAEAVVAAACGAARLAPPTPDLADLAALFACARLAIGPDTGPLHVAALVGTPVVQLLGPTDPVENAPWPGTPSRRVRAAPAGDVAGSTGSIGADAIVAAARELLRPAPPADPRAGATV
jgi:ADP-heptose:LPS heptosyltransferase